MNALVEMLRTKGFIGREKPVSRKDAARLMGTSVREVQSLSEESRKAGVPAEWVGYTSAGKKKGLYLCVNSDEIDLMVKKILRECKARFPQIRGGKLALRTVMPNTVWPTPPETLKQSEMFP